MNDPSSRRGAIVRLSAIGTELFVLLGIQASILPDVVAPFVALALVEFFIGLAVFVWAFLVAVDRSRTENIGIGGLFFASGSAPRDVQVLLVGSLVVQTVASIVFASIRLYTPLAFGVLAPMWSLGLTGLWVARHGVFPPRQPEPTRAAQRAAAREEHRRAAGSQPLPEMGDRTSAETGEE